MDRITVLLDLHEEGFFIHEFGDLQTANLIFEVFSPIARGRLERIMISIILIEKGYKLSLSSFHEIMEFFVNKFKNIKDIYKGFYYASKPSAIDKYNEMKDLMYSFHQSLTTIKENISKINVYGLSPTGKNNIIRCFQEKFSQSRQQIDNFSINPEFKRFLP